MTNDDAISDLIMLVSYLLQSKTPPLPLKAALDRLHARAKLVPNLNAGSTLDYYVKLSEGKK